MEYVAPLRRFANGVVRATAFGEHATAVRGRVTSGYLVVRKRRGVRLWTWHLETNLRPVLRRDGSVLLRGSFPLLVQQPNVYDGRGRDLVPGQIRWRLGREGSGWRLSFRLDDSRFPLPYVIVS